MYSKELGIIGTGKIGSALLRRLISTNTIERSKIITFDIDENKRNKLSEECKVDFAESNEELARSSTLRLNIVMYFKDS